MGLIKSIMTATSSTLADQWKEYFYCNTLDKDVLVVKGQKKISSRSSNTKGSDNIITNGSGVVVNEGQCMLIVDQGKVVEVCAEPGEFTYDSSSEPSLFYGSLGKGIIDTFKTIGKRFTYGGDTAKDQRVYYINIKEIMDNKFGTANPIPFRVVDRNINLDIDISICCHGTYSYKIVDPLLFYTNVCGNIEEQFYRKEIDRQLKIELLSALQIAFSKVSELGIRYSSLPGHTDMIVELLNNILNEKWTLLRGLKVISVAIGTIAADGEDEDLIKNIQKTAILRDPSMAAATLVEAQSEAMKKAANNPGGKAVGFMNMDLIQNVNEINTQGLYNMNDKKMVVGYTANNNQKVCQYVTKNTKKGWTCLCGTMNLGQFCRECGRKKPDDVPLYRCDKCGWEPDDLCHPPRFCPECGDIFDDNDKR